MITLDEFISKWTGKGIDYDGAYGNQCVDLYRQYIKECLGIPQTPGVTGAKDIWNNCPGFDKIVNTPEGVPQKGDVMIWGASYGPYGHVAVVTEATVNTFKCFSQNDPAGTLPAIKWYKTYTPVIGWLRVVRPEDTAQLKIDLAEQQKQVANLQSQVNGLLADGGKKDALIQEITNQLTEAKDSSDGFRKQHNEFVATLANILGTRQETVEIVASVKRLPDLEDKADELAREKDLQAKEYQYTIGQLEKEISALKSTTESSTARILQLETTIKDLKYSPTTPIQTNSFWSIIKSIIGIK